MRHQYGVMTEILGRRCQGKPLAGAAEPWPRATGFRLPEPRSKSREPRGASSQRAQQERLALRAIHQPVRTGSGRRQWRRRVGPALRRWRPALWLVATGAHVAPAIKGRACDARAPGRAHWLWAAAGSATLLGQLTAWSSGAPAACIAAAAPRRPPPPTLPPPPPAPPRDRLYD